MSNCRNKCNTDPCEESIRCKRPTSELVYDGCDLPLWNARNGDSLNTVIYNAYNAYKQLYNNTRPFYIEHFDNASKVSLSVKPLEVHMVAICGNIVPTKFWEPIGQEISFDPSICTEEGEVTVIYQGPMKNQFQTNCML